MGIHINGTGFRLGSVEVTNDWIAQQCGLSEEDIINKTGIQTRWYLSDDETLVDLASAAVSDALGEGPPTADFLGCATFAHEVVYPSLASRTAAALKADIPQLFDLQSNCTGFLNLLLMGHDKLVADEGISRGLVVAAESNSPFIDSTNPESVMFWSDGVGAVLLERNPSTTGGLLGRAYMANTESNMAVRLPWDSVTAQGGEPAGRRTLAVEMGGLATWRQATSGLPQVVRAALADAGLSIDDIDHVVFHQANLRMLEYLVRKMRIPEDKVLLNVQRVGNLGAASIPVMLAQADEAGDLARGDRILLAAVGAGFTFVGAVWEW